MNRIGRSLILSGLALAACSAPAVGADYDALRDQAEALEARTIAWRHDLHRNPELSNREFRTAELVAAHLESLGLETRTGIAHTGVLGVLRGGRPGPVIALRADMDALPVTEQTGLPYASTRTATFNGQETGVMHACGHDAHVSILMATAELLAGMREQLPGTILFIFQPAEEGAPVGEEGGAKLMLAEGVFADPRPAAIFGLHVTSLLPSGVTAVRAGPLMAGADRFEIVVTGSQTHGAKPWQGVDPIVTAAQIVMGLQTIASRQVDVTLAPSVISVGMIEGGIRFNIIPDDVKLVGTIRTFDEDMRADIHRRMERTATSIAEAAGATASVEIGLGLPVTVNDPALTERMRPVLERAVGAAAVRTAELATWAEDFSYYAREVPGFFFFLGVTAADKDPATAPPNHSPFFEVDDAGLATGVVALSSLAIEYLEGG